MANAKGVISALDMRIAETAAQIATQMTQELRTATPKRTGRAAFNWVPRIGRRFLRVAATPIPQLNGLDKLKAYERGQGNIFITNNVPYVRRLNDGSSSQAPRAFVEITVFRVLRSRVR